MDSSNSSPFAFVLCLIIVGAAVVPKAAHHLVAAVSDTSKTVAVATIPTPTPAKVMASAVPPDSNSHVEVILLAMLAFALIGFALWKAHHWLKEVFANFHAAFDSHSQKIKDLNAEIASGSWRLTGALETIIELQKTVDKLDGQFKALVATEPPNSANPNAAKRVEQQAQIQAATALNRAVEGLIGKKNNEEVRS